MKSPFPGMDPFLEGDDWSEVHHLLAGVFKELLRAVLPTHYVAKIEHYTYVDTEFSDKLVVVYPDVEILERKTSKVSEPRADYGNTAVLTPPALVIPPVKSVKVEISYLEIRDKRKDQVVTAIEILSPVNKRKPGLDDYRDKRKNFQKGGVHLLEIDLLRGGTRPFNHSALPSSSYRVLLWRATSGETEAWTMSIRDKLPVVPVPLKSPDPDVQLDLGKAFDIVYERSDYRAELNYQEDPPLPPLSEEDWLWMKQLLQKENAV